MKTNEVMLKTNYNVILKNCLLLWGRNLFIPIKDEKKPEYYQVSIAVHDKNPGMDSIRSIHKAFSDKYQNQMSKYSVYKAFSRDKQNRLRQYFDILESRLPSDAWGRELLNRRSLTTRIDDYNSLSLYSSCRDFFVTSQDDKGNVSQHTTQPNPDMFNTGAVVNVSFYLYYYESKEFMIGDATKSRMAIRPRCELESIHFVEEGFASLFKDLPVSSPSSGIKFDKQARFGVPVEEFELSLNDDDNAHFNI